jgi:hypothetical protein
VPPAWAAGKDEPAGYSYAGLLVRAERGDLLGHLAGVRFSGWVGPQEAGWVVAVPARSRRPAAQRAARLQVLGADVATRLSAVTLAVFVHEDRVLRLSMWSGPDELGHYLSDPAYGVPDEDVDDEVIPGPQGFEHADSFATACGRAEQAEDLGELLAEMLDEESQIESERLATALKLLGLPIWLVAVNSLPRDVPAGPRANELTRLLRGRTGPLARIGAWLTDLIRRRRSP